MDDLIGGLKEKAKEFGMEKIKEEADKRGLGGLVVQAEGLLGLDGQKPAVAAEAPAEEAALETVDAPETGDSEESGEDEEK